VTRSASGIFADQAQPAAELSILANIRFGLEKIRPEIRRYFLKRHRRNAFNRSKRAVAYRARRGLDKRPFGTQQNIYGDNFEWINHSITPFPIDSHDFPLKVGGAEYPAACAVRSSHPFRHELRRAERERHSRAQQGAKLGSFAHTRRGSISRYHRNSAGT
jgi:hypothetical protein